MFGSLLQRCKLKGKYTGESGTRLRELLQDMVQAAEGLAVPERVLMYVDG